MIRKPTGPFGWLDASLLHEEHLSRIGPDATAVLAFLAIAADRHGASFYRRDRMALSLGLTRSRLDDALQILLHFGFVVHRPWSRENQDGVWQLLPIKRQKPPSRGGDPTQIRDIFKQLAGKEPPDCQDPRESDHHDPRKDGCGS